MIFVSFDTSVSQSSGLRTNGHYDNKSSAGRTVKEAPMMLLLLLRSPEMWSYIPVEQLRFPPFSCQTSVQRFFSFCCFFLLVWMENVVPTQERKRVGIERLDNPPDQSAVDMTTITALSQSGSAPNTQPCAYWLVSKDLPVQILTAPGEERVECDLSPITSPANQQTRTFLRND